MELVPSPEARPWARPRGAEALWGDPTVGHLLSLQRPDGAWEGEMVWNTMILSQYVIVRHLTGTPITDEATRRGMIRHYQVSGNPDGSFGMHGESPGYVFFTTLAYLALRLLGLGPDDPLCRAARGWLHRQPGGVLSIPTWGKYWLAFLDLYDYRGCNPCPPELFALPGQVPVHPSKYYCHTRYIYIALSFLYGSRFRGDLGALREPLRRELYAAPYGSLDFAAHRHDVAASDLFVAPSANLRRAADAMALFERLRPRRLRQRALDHCFDRILYEQRASRYQGLSPVNALLNCLAIYSRGRDHVELAPSLAGLEAWRWQDQSAGIRYAGARSQTWDTAFAMQALLDGPDAPRAGEALRRAYRYLVSVQMTEELPRYQDEERDAILGGFCFSDGQHRWPVADCTAEAVAALLTLEEHPELGPAAKDRIPRPRLLQAAEFLIRHQNEDGGFGTYERRRGGPFLEGINNTEMYGSCMTERSYLECTASSIGALAQLRRHLPELAGGLDGPIARGVELLRREQRPDGSWAGFWGINFTYGIFHVVKGLRHAGLPVADPALQRAAAWLLDHQKSDGSFGEHYRSCLEDRYVEHPEGQATMTSWALLTLVELLGPRHPAVERAAAWLRRRRGEDGAFPGEAQNGVFFGSAMLDYRLYKAYFPAWALGRHERLRRAADAGV